MNAERELFHAYAEWRRLAEAETTAIQSHNWSLLADCQHAIEDFQKHVSRLTLEAREEWRRKGENLPAKEKQIQALVGELIELTRQNHALLAAARKIAQFRLGELREAGLNLKRLRSYALQAA
jgi:predicted RNase H-like nuclease (RuvC/YqgF family)